MTKVQFQHHGVSFMSTLRSRVDEYFKQLNKPSTGNFSLYAKAAIIILSTIGLYVWLVFFTPQAIWLSLTLCGLFGICLALIGFNIMHDGSHGSFSRKPWVNKATALTLNVLGGNAQFWNQKHVVNHHTYTNINGMDDDLDAEPFFRMNDGQKRRWFHRWQHIYWVLLYGLLYFFWITTKDMKKYVSRKITPQSNQFKMTTADHLLFWGSKFVHTIVFIAIPLYFVGWQALVGWSLAMFVLGLCLSVVFQLAHVMDTTEFVSPEYPTTAVAVHNEWAVHQLQTTSNFATKNPVITWLLGGLNFQVEHHLFPRISHVHYPKINEIVKNTCKEFGITYLEEKTMISALAAHVGYLRKLGRS